MHLPGLNFSNYQLGVLVIATAVLYWVGIMTFKTFLFNWTWKSIFLFGMIANTVFSVLQ
eukprot:gene34955-43104_t